MMYSIELCPQNYQGKQQLCQQLLFHINVSRHEYGKDCFTLLLWQDISIVIIIKTLEELVGIDLYFIIICVGVIVEAYAFAAAIYQYVIAYHLLAISPRNLEESRLNPYASKSCINHSKSTKQFLVFQIVTLYSNFALNVKCYKRELCMKGT